MRVNAVLVLLLMLPLLSACGGDSSQTPASLSVDQLYVGTDCGSHNRKADMQLYASYEALEKGIKSLPIINKISKVSVAKIKAKNNYILQINMGQKSTGGYALKLGSETMILTDGHADIQVVWRVPAANAFITQALTSPCVLLGIPAVDYKRISIIDQHKREKLQLRL